MPASTLYDAARALLDAALAALQAEGLPVPARAYVSVGEAAADCDQLVCWHTVVTPREHDQAPVPKRGAPRVTTATLTLELVRCSPIPDDINHPPAASVIEAEAAALYAAGWTIYRGVEQRLLPDDGGQAPLLGGACRPTALGGMQPVSSQGGAWGWRVELGVVLDAEGWWPGA